MRLKQGPGPGRDRSGLPYRADRSTVQLPFGGEDPLRWGVPLFRFGGISVGIHAIVILWIGAEMVAWLPRGNLGLIHAASLVLGLLATSMMREVARALLARWLGARAGSEGLDGGKERSDVLEAMVWPLGGLTSAAPLGVRRTIAAELGGIGAGLLLVLPAAAMVILAGAPVTTLLFDPMSPRVTAAELRSPAQVLAWWFYYANAIVLALNLLLPMLPFDLGRIAMAVTRRKSGMAAASAVVLRVGLVTALALLVVAGTLDQTRMIAVAAVGALATWLEHRRLAFMADPLTRSSSRSATGSDGLEDEELRVGSGGGSKASRGGSGVSGADASRPTRPGRGPGGSAGARPAPGGTSGGAGPGAGGVRKAGPGDVGNRGSDSDESVDTAARGTARNEASSVKMDLDVILAKISGGGLQSLTDEERKFLARETERRRGS